MSPVVAPFPVPACVGFWFLCLFAFAREIRMITDTRNMVMNEPSYSGYNVTKLSNFITFFLLSSEHDSLCQAFVLFHS
jgi:hypothetical protein